MKSLTSWLSAAVLAAGAVAILPNSGRADDDWEDRLEDYYDRLEDRWDDYEDAVEDRLKYEKRMARRQYRGYPPVGQTRYYRTPDRYRYPYRNLSPTYQLFYYGSGFPGYRPPALVPPSYYRSQTFYGRSPYCPW